MFSPCEGSRQAAQRPSASGRVCSRTECPGMTDASATWRRSVPRTRPLASTTASGFESGPMLQVPTGWWYVQHVRRIQSRRSWRPLGTRALGAWSSGLSARTAGWSASCSAISSPSARRSRSTGARRYRGRWTGDRPRLRGPARRVRASVVSSAAAILNVGGASSAPGIGPKARSWRSGGGSSCCDGTVLRRERPERAARGAMPLLRRAALDRHCDVV